ncbi:sorting and assembly machinery component 50 [Schistosoma haematobium]|uniref:Sorting and assembly machinery component 50 n=1 Tax=Schistosoma haematobium TaxID=6185 RepID=A0A922LE24_SCHHA|nr:sorting and assembly machinery component 50 [Schistosoma haematobium]KAH9579516.1 sorting and assembly machinery component 50 [Schistosoma haematobium]
MTRRVPVHLEAEVNRQVHEMLDEGIIEEADNSPVLLVKKPNGKYRFCVDFRELNNITELKPCAMPTVVETLDRLQNATVFTVLDLRSGCWQLPVKDSDQGKTTFTVRDKQYQFKRMPFGLAGAPFTFRRIMTLLLRNLDNVKVYGDDVVVYSQTEIDHVKHVEAVLRRIDEFGLRINKDKSQSEK